MKASTEMKIMQLCKGLSLKQVDKRLALMVRYCEQRQLELKMKVTGLNIGGLR